MTKIGVQNPDDGTKRTGAELEWSLYRCTSGDVQVAESELKNERVRTKTKMAGPSGARGNETLMNLFW